MNTVPEALPIKLFTVVINSLELVNLLQKGYIGLALEHQRVFEASTHSVCKLDHFIVLKKIVYINETA